MPVNEIVAEATGGTSPVERTEAPEDDGAPSGKPEPTTLNTPRLMPPYIHNQTLDNRGALMMLTTVLTLIGLVQTVMG